MTLNVPAQVLTIGPDPYRLREILLGGTPLAWLYAALDQEPFVRAEQIRGLRAELVRAGAPPAAREAMLARLAAEPRAPGTFAVVADDDGRVLLVRQLRVQSAGDRAGWSTPPRLLPVLGADQRRPPWVLAVVDRTGAEVSCSAGADEPATTVTVVGTDDEVERNAPGGWAQARYRRRAEDSWEHNAGQVAAVVTQALTRVHAQALVMSGDSRMVQLVESRVPPALVPDVRILHGSRSADGTQSVRTQRVAAALADIADEQNRRILAQLQDGLGPGGIAVEGVEDTFGALAEGRVGLLVLTDALGEATVWYGPRPTSVFATAEAARLSHQPVATGDLADVAVRAALVAEGRVRLVPAADPHAPRDGIGALCRYPD